MTPEGLARVATPDLFGFYDVDVDRRTEGSLFDELAGEFHEPIWHIHIQRALFELNHSTLRELRSYEGDVPVAFSCQVNMRTGDPITKILFTPVEFVADLTPVPKVPTDAPSV